MRDAPRLSLRRYGLKSKPGASGARSSAGSGVTEAGLLDKTRKLRIRFPFSYTRDFVSHMLGQDRHTSICVCHVDAHQLGIVRALGSQKYEVT
jgi:hypothetical protein